jgi:hypothetical protein
MALTKVPGSMALRTVVSKTTTYAATAYDDVILCSGSAFTVTLPAASTSGKQLVIKKTDSSFTNIVTIARAGSDTIDGATSKLLTTLNDTITLVSDGTTTWQVVNRTWSTIWTAYSPTTAGYGTPSAADFVWRRSGVDSIDIRGRIVPGTPTAVQATISIPTGSIDSTKCPTMQVAGRVQRNSASATFFGGGVALISGTNTALQFSAEYSTADATTPQNASTLYGAGDVLLINAYGIPITTWG